MNKSGLGQRVFHSGGFSAHAGQHVGVRIEGDGDGSVAEELLYEFRVYVSLEQERGTRVPEVVEGDLWHAGTLEERCERPVTEVGGINEAAALAREHEP
jgi:hypothetical protein